MRIGFFGGKFLPFHMGHMSVAMGAIGLVDKLYIVLSSSEKRDRLICKNDNTKYMSSTLRMSWLGKIFSGYENVEVINIVDDFIDYDWDVGSKLIKKAIPEKITHIFGSEPQYIKYFNKYYPEAKYVCGNRSLISATEIRRNNKIDHLPKEVRKYFIKKIAIVGTESCGKTILTKKLANYFNEPYIHEVGREYCIKYSNNLTEDIFNKIAMEHFLLHEGAEANRMLFIDSDAVITGYYLNMYLGRRSKLIEEISKLQEFDLVLYCDINVKWVEDGLRFAEKERKQNNELLKRMYKCNNIKYEIINKDNYNDRFLQAKDIILRKFGNHIIIKED